MSVLEATFIAALGFVSSDPKKAKSYLTDKRLTQPERTILRCYFLMRDNKLLEVLSELTCIKGELSPVVEAQMNLIFGIANNQLSHFKLAKDYLDKSLEQLKSLPLPVFFKVALLNRFIVAYNQKDGPAMAVILNQLQQLKLVSEIDRIRVLQCGLKFFTFHQNEHECQKLIEQIDGLQSFMSEADRINHLICKFEYHVKFEMFEACYDDLEAMKDCRKFNFSQNFKFMKLLLDHFTQHVPIYVDDKIFLEHPILYHQLKVIQMLEEGNQPKAREQWQHLNQLNPELYQNNFVFLGGKTVFQLCLEKYQVVKNQQPEVDLEGDAKFENLYKILIEAKGPLRKEYLFELLWGHPPENKHDFVRLSKCIYRMKTKYRLSVKTRKGSYFLEETFWPSKKKSS